MSKKITLATIKSFIRKNRAELLVNVKSSFDSSIDGQSSRNDGFKRATESDCPCANNLGISGLWFVGGGRNFFDPYSENGLTGYKIGNCCARFIVAIKA